MKLLALACILSLFTPALASAENLSKILKSDTSRAFEIQKSLSSHGFEFGGADGIWGRKSGAALEQYFSRYQVDKDLIENVRSLEKLMGQTLDLERFRAGKIRSRKCDNLSYAFLGDLQNGCTQKHEIGSAIERYQLSKLKSELHYPAYYQLKQQAQSIVIPSNANIFKMNPNEVQHQSNPNFVIRPECKAIAAKLDTQNPQNGLLPQVIRADLSVDFGSGSANRRKLEKYLPPLYKLGYECLGGETGACNAIIDGAHDASVKNLLRIENLDQIWQTAFEINDFYLRSFLMVYSAALPRATNSTMEKHTAIGAWLENVINSADEYTYYNFYSELLDGEPYLGNHDLSQASARMHYGILWGNAERIVEGLNLYKQEINLLRADGSFPYESSRGVSSLFYINKVMRDLVTLAELARSIDIDLYSYTSPDGLSIHDAANFVVRAVSDDTLIRKYAVRQAADSLAYFGIAQWPEISYDNNWLGNKGGWYYIYRNRFPSSDAVSFVKETPDPKLYIYGDTRIRNVTRNSEWPLNPICMFDRSRIMNLDEAQKNYSRKPSMDIWSIEFNELYLPTDFGLLTTFKANTLLKQTEFGQIEYALISEGKKLSKQDRIAVLSAKFSKDILAGNNNMRTDFSFDEQTARHLETQCNVEIIEAADSYYPLLPITELWNASFTRTELSGLSDASQCLVEFIGNRFSYKTIADTLRAGGLALQGKSIDGILSEDAARLEAIKTLTDQFRSIGR